jgi:hypothetical protein
MANATGAFSTSRRFPGVRSDVEAAFVFGRRRKSHATSNLAEIAPRFFYERGTGMKNTRCGFGGHLELRRLHPGSDASMRLGLDLK